MPALSIIPASAVADAAISDTHLRVLCAIGTFTNRLGGNVWASVTTLAKACHLSDRTIQRAIPALVAAGYLRRTERPGRTTLYEVVLEPGVSGVTTMSPTGDTPVTPPPTEESPKRYKRTIKTNDLHEQAREVAQVIWPVYPKRDTDHLWHPAIRAISEVLSEGAAPAQLVNAAQEYAEYCRRTGTDPRYVKTIARFFSEGAWRSYATVQRVYGRTREEWARSGQDVSEFDRLAHTMERAS
jgi:hypothetical protein